MDIVKFLSTGEEKTLEYQPNKFNDFNGYTNSVLTPEQLAAQGLGHMLPAPLTTGNDAQYTPGHYATPAPASTPFGAALGGAAILGLVPAPHTKVPFAPKEPEAETVWKSPSTADRMALQKLNSQGFYKR